MYNVTELKTGLIGLIGWRQNVDPSGWQLTDLITSQSGLFFNDVHPLLSIDNLISIAPEFERVDPDQTAINTAFNAWLKEKTEAAIVQTVDAFISAKFEKQTAKNLLEVETLFDVTGNFTDLETSSGDVVGIEIVPSRSNSMQTKIQKIGVQFDTDQTVEIKLFKSGIKAAIQTESVIYSGGGSVQWVQVDWTLEGNGAYFIAYDQNLISGNAINGVKNYTWKDRGLTSYPSGRHYKATAFNASIADASELWDLNETNYSVSTNYGLNLSLSVRCDYTSFILDQKDLFKTAIALQTGINLLRELAFNPSTRVNRNESNVDRAQVLYEIDGDTQGRNNSTIHARFLKAIDSIQFDQSSIDKICLPCRKRGIRFSSVGPYQ